MIPCLHFGLRLASGRFPIEPKLASWVESGYKSPESPGPRQRGRRRDGLSRRRRGRFRSTAPYPAATNSRGVSKPRPRRDNGLTFDDLSEDDDRSLTDSRYIDNRMCRLPNVGDRPSNSPGCRRWRWCEGSWWGLHPHGQPNASVNLRVTLPNWSSSTS